ncbi:MAG: hypothetical protein KBE25_03755 [Laribacter sp.]|nr:hypothetical protein [Laribacter sp.]MBP9526917.1 hypothetical protein [Laribacter sp.]MBP9608448.1 hypothetical protein [Laribacter sp.]
MQINNHVLTIGDISQTLPQLAVPATVDIWSVPADYRGNGHFVAVTPAGQAPEIPACSGAAATLLASLPLEPHPEAVLDAARARHRARINAACAADLDALSASYPQGEMQSWSQQVKEADALAADPTAATPLLGAIAAARGLSVAELAGRVQAKTAAYSLASGELIGRRQAAEDRIAAAASIEELEAVAW